MYKKALEVIRYYLEGKGRPACTPNRALDLVWVDALFGLIFHS